jgi:hypothetical protein
VFIAQRGAAAARSIVAPMYEHAWLNGRSSLSVTSPLTAIVPLHTCRSNGGKKALNRS